MSQPTVVQVVRTYLPRTENWIYEQVRHVERYRQVFASKAIANADLFPFDAVYSLSRSPLRTRLFDRAYSRRLGYSPYFSDVFTREKARIVHAHGGLVGSFIASSAERLSLPLVVSFYGVDMWKHPDGETGLRAKYTDVFRTGALFLAEGPAAANQLARIGCPEEKIIVHRLGVDVQSIPFVERNRDGRALRILMASRFVEKKGIPYGVEAFCRVAHDNPSMRLTIVGDSGSARDAKAIKQIMDIAHRYRVERQVCVRGFMALSELRELADEHDILLHPSVTAGNGDSEGGHPVVMTMLAAGGMPILATTHCDIPQIVEDKRTGWLVSERNAGEIEGVLRSVVSDSSCLPEFGRSARKLVEDRYDIRAMRLDSVYDRITGAR